MCTYIGLIERGQFTERYNEREREREGEREAILRSFVLTNDKSNYNSIYHEEKIWRNCVINRSKKQCPI